VQKRRQERHGLSMACPSLKRAAGLRVRFGEVSPETAA
jgi:hypothetical protein